MLPMMLIAEARGDRAAVTVPAAGGFSSPADPRIHETSGFTALRRWLVRVADNAALRQLASCNGAALAILRLLVSSGSGHCGTVTACYRDHWLVLVGRPLRGEPESRVQRSGVVRLGSRMSVMLAWRCRIAVASIQRGRFV